MLNKKRIVLAAAHGMDNQPVSNEKNDNIYKRHKKLRKANCLSCNALVVNCPCSVHVSG